MDVVAAWVVCSFAYLFIAGMTARVLSEEFDYQLRPYTNAKSFALGLVWPLVWLVTLTFAFLSWLTEK